jgi:hypothetical protein
MRKNRRLLWAQIIAFGIAELMRFSGSSVVAVEFLSRRRSPFEAIAQPQVPRTPAADAIAESQYFDDWFCDHG